MMLDELEETAEIVGAVVSTVIERLEEAIDTFPAGSVCFAFMVA